MDGHAEQIGTPIERLSGAVDRLRHSQNGEADRMALIVAGLAASGKPSGQIFETATGLMDQIAEKYGR